MPTIAVADDFFTAFAALPKKIQKAVRELTRKFRQDPTARGLNYEPIQGARDPRLKSLRVNQEYRAIALAPDAGDVFVLLWVDHHDEAYRWAENKRVDVHPVTGSLQLLSAEAETWRASEPEPPPQASAVSSRFSSWSDEQLFSAGVPRALIPAVRAVYTDADLESLAPHLPTDSAEVLTGLAAGMTLDEALEEVLARPMAEIGPVDPADVVAALERPQSGRKFKVLDKDFDLEAALDQPLERWRVFLHPSQRDLATRPSKGPLRVLGAAGTGKTVVAMHRAAWLARQAGKEGRILFTTFTVNLASDIQTSLATLVAPEEMQRIEVVSIDALAARILRDDVGEPVRLATGDDLRRAWQEAVDLEGDGTRKADFYQVEWQDVIRAQGINDLEGYLVARRLGRGAKVTRSERRAIWQVFEAFKTCLSERGLTEREEILKRARVAAERIERNVRTYDHVVVDEVQDMSAEALRLLRVLAGLEHENDLFLVGDAHQRIYGRAIALSSCGINVRGRRSRTLRINYRTTDSIRRLAMRVLAGETFDDLDEGTDEARGYVSLRSGPEPTLRHFESLSDEQRFLADEVKRLIAQGMSASHICVAARTKELLTDWYEPALAGEGIQVEFLGRDAPRTPHVRLSTMHRVKGLEFPVVFVAGVQQDIVPLQTHDLESEDISVARQAEKRERCLLYVSSSRARDVLYISGHGARSPFM